MAAVATPASVLKELIEALIAKRDLSKEEAGRGVEAIIGGADPCQAAAFLVLLRAKGESADEESVEAAEAPIPHKRAKRAEEAKVLSWEQLRALFSLE